MVMTTIGLLRNHPNPSDQDIERVMDRNICRCGTYPRIVRAIKQAAQAKKVSGTDEKGT
jgi:isoquinoline 1-oxidoreductase alpha subunit